MRRVAAVLVASLLLACSGDDGVGAAGSGDGGGGSGGAPARAPEVRFELGDGDVPRFLDVPWPSDLYIEGDGTIVDALPGLDAYVTAQSAAIEAAFAKQRGFGVNTGALFRVVVPTADDPLGLAAVDVTSLPADAAASLAADASVFLVDLDAHVRVPARVAWHDEAPLGSSSPPLLSVMPARGVVLAPGHRHAAFVTKKVTAGGRPVTASAGFAAVRKGPPAAAKLYGGALDALADVSPKVDASSVVGLAVFTPMDAADELAQMRAQTLALAPPTLSWAASDLAPMGVGLFADHAVAGFNATFDDWLGSPKKLPDGGDDPARDQGGGAAHDALAALGTAVMDAPNFLQQRSEGYSNPEHAVVARDASGAPVLDPDDPTAKVWITFALPKTPMPAEGFPVVILQHGLGGDRSFILALANTFAKEGWATVAIDAPTFGTRAASASDKVDARANFPWSAGAAYSGPDGFVDTNASPVDFFGEFLNFGAVRDQLREAVIDISTVADVAGDPALDLGPLLDAVPGAKFDAARIGYVGDSLGGIIGLMVASVDPKIRRFVINVGGGGVLTEVAANSPNLAQLISIGAVVYGFHGGRFDESSGFVNLLQSIIDPADPLTHARFLSAEDRVVAGVTNPKKDIVLIEAVWDEIVANEGTEALAVAAGMPIATPNIGPNASGVSLPAAAPDGAGIHDVPVAGATMVLVQASPGTHGSDLYNARGGRAYEPPFARPGPQPFPSLSTPFDVAEPYLGLQKMAVGFFSSSFAGGPAIVADFPAPKRDFDGDGVDDAEDKSPFDPTH